MTATFFSLTVVAIYFASIYCNQTTNIMVVATSSSMFINILLQISGAVIGGVIVDQWNRVHCLSGVAVLAALSGGLTLIGECSNISVVKSSGIYMSGSFLSMFSVVLLAFVCVRENRTRVPWLFGILASIQTLGALCGSFLFPADYVHTFTSNTIILITVSMTIWYFMPPTQYADNEMDEEEAIGPLLSDEEDISSNSSGMDSFTDCLHEPSSSSYLNLNALRKKLWPINGNPGFYITLVCGFCLAGCFLPLKGILFDLDDWEVASTGMISRHGNIWLSIVPGLVSASLSPFIGSLIYRHGSRPGLIAVAAAFSCIAHGMFPPDLDAVLPKLITLGIAHSMSNVTLWSVVPIIVKEHQTGAAFAAIISTQKISQLLIVALSDSFSPTPSPSNFDNNPIVASETKAVDVVFLAVSALAVFSAVWLVYADETGNGSKNHSRHKSRIPFSPKSKRDEHVYVIGALRRVTDTTTMSELMNSGDDVDPRSECATPDLEVEINTMINKTSGKWDPNPHYLAFKTVSKGRRALLKELVSQGGIVEGQSEGTADDDKDCDGTFMTGSQLHHSRTFTPSRSKGNESTTSGTMERPCHISILRSEMGDICPDPPRLISSSSLCERNDSAMSRTKRGEYSRQTSENSSEGTCSLFATITESFDLGAHSTCRVVEEGKGHSNAIGGVAADSLALSERTPLLSCSLTTSAYSSSMISRSMPSASSLERKHHHVEVAYSCGAWYGDDGDDDDEGGRGQEGDGSSTTTTPQASTVFGIGPGSLPSQTHMERLMKGVKFAGDVNSFPERKMGVGQHPRIPMKKKRSKSNEEFPMRYYT